MRTTIEPRLMSSPNNDTSESPTKPTSFELPPLHDRNILQTSHRPLPLEPSTGTRSGESSQVSQHSPSIAPIDDNDPSYRDAEETSRTGTVCTTGKDAGAIEHTLGSSSPQSLRKILDNNTGNARPLHPKKQQRRESGKDDFVQLPRPPKKQRSNKQVVPPIIIGLHEPPPQAALTNGDLKPDAVVISAPVGYWDQNVNTKKKKKKKKKDIKPKNNRWSEEETNNLLLGVHKYGVGKWTDILEDPNFEFNSRSGVDLKDRFRTCCPDELRGESRNPRSDNIVPKANDTGEQPRTEVETLGSSSGNPALGKDQETDGTSPNFASSQLLHPGSKPRSHRKKLTDLQQLGIQGPFKQSERRERRPFSEQDDREITQGYEIYGPAWTKIQRDPQFNLQSRQPTDLRDRFRNKHPEKFRSGEDDAARTASPSNPAPVDDSSNTSNNLTTDSGTSNLNQEPLKHTVESTDGLAFSQSFEWTESNLSTPPFPGNIGEMDISRSLDHPYPWTP